MSRRLSLFLLTLVCGCLFTNTQICLSQAKIIKKPASVKPFRSQYYVVYTDMSAKEARAYAKHMDKLYVEIAKRFKGFKQKRKWHRLLFIFKDKEGYKQFLVVNGIDVKNSSGLFFARGDELAVVSFVGKRSRSEVLGVLQHEGFHQFAAYFFMGRLPVSINEGLAEYFQDAIPYKNRLHLGVADSRRLSQVKQDMKAKKLISMQALLTITPDQWRKTLSADAKAGQRLYNQSWALVYFLIKSDRKVFLQFAAYLNYLNSGMNATRSFKKAFPNTRGLENNWRTFLSKLEPDPLVVTINKIEFLSQGLQWAAQTGKPMPKTLNELKQLLRSQNFKLKRTLGNTVELFDSRNEANFQYTSKKGKSEFLLKPAKKAGEFPTISAPTMRPRPELIWFEDKGVLISEVVLK